MGTRIDITGKTFGALVAIEPTQRALSSGRRMPAWKLRCECGVEVVAMTVNLVKGKHMSCGCKRSERTMKARGFKGDTKKPVYRVYRQMLDRCYLPSAPNFSYYGAKGVTVCDRWRFGEDGKTGFQCFEEDMGDRPDGLTLDRNDPFKPYEKANCRWATWAEQASNKREHHSPATRIEARKRRSLMVAGEKSPVAKLTNEQVSVIKRRLINGERPLYLAREYGVAPQTLNGIKNGWSWKSVPPRAF